MKSPKIIHTTEYGIFLRYKSNRDINKHHLAKLCKSIQRKNLLHLFPIVVNENMDVIDGQHRLEAAKTLSVPIYFVVDKEVSKADIAIVNNSRKQWSGRDYINFYASEGEEAYLCLKELLTSFPKLSIMAGVKLMRPDTRHYTFSKGVGGGTDTESLRTGKISCEYFKQALHTLQIAKSISQRVTYIFRPDLLLDIKKAYIDNGLSKAECMRILEEKAHVFPRHSTPQDLAPNRIIRELLGNQTKKS